MAIRSKDELLASARTLIGDRTDADALSILEDITDTMDDYQSRNGVDIEGMKAEYEQKLTDLDNTWSQRYRDRFFNTSAESIDTPPANGVAPAPVNPEEPPSEEVTPENVTFDDLFVEA